MLFTFVVIVTLCVSVQSQKLDFSQLLGGEGDGPLSPHRNLKSQVLDILKSIDLADLERDLKETNSGIREGAAELVKEQMHKASHTVPKMEAMASGLASSLSRKRPSSLKGSGGGGGGNGGCPCESGSFDMQEVMASSSRKLKRAMAARLLKAASQLLGKSPPSPLSMRHH